MAALFENKIALVTGAAGGIGEASARRLAAEGAHVLCADVNMGGAARVAGEIGGEALALDVRRLDAWESALAGVVAKQGRLDIVHLNAGVMTRPVGAPLADDPVPWLQQDGYEKVMSVNADGVVFGVIAAVPHLEAAGGGDIVITASVAGVDGFAPDPFYSMSKFAVVGFTRSLGPVLKRRGIRVNAVCPGGIDTGLVPPDLRHRDGVTFSPPSYIADAVVTIITSGATGGVWVAYAEGIAPWRYETPDPRIAPT